MPRVKTIWASTGGISSKSTSSFSAPQRNLPMGSLLRSMAQKIVHERVKTQPKSRSHRSSHAKFSDEQVRLLRALRARGVLPHELALIVGMTVDSMKAILSGRNYSDVI